MIPRNAQRSPKITRDPVSRLWSAWQSKLLLHEPGIGRRFQQEAWYPGVPVSAEEIVNAFRAFVRELASDKPPYDAHWLPQALTFDQAPPLNHIGRLESLQDTL